jgi:dienelactone hydrolase
MARTLRTLPSSTRPNRCLLVLVTLTTFAWASAAGANVEPRRAGDGSEREERAFAVGQQTLTLVDTSRPTPPGNGQPAAPTRTIETLVLYPARGAPGGTSVAQAPPVPNARFPVAVFLHGSGTTGEDYRGALERWVAAGYVVAAPTAPLGGHGVEGSNALIADRSNHPDDVRFVLEKLAAKLPSTVRRIANFDRVALIGKSLGAATAMEVAFDPSGADERIRAVVAIAEPLAGSPWAGSVPARSDLASGTRVPALFVHSETDQGFPYDGSRTNFDIARAPKFLLTLIGASHEQTLSVDGIGPVDDAVILGTLDFLDRYAKSHKAALGRLRRDTNMPGVAHLESSLRN